MARAISDRPTSTSASPGGNAYDLTAADFDGDGLPDIAVAYGTPTYVLLNTSH